MTSDHPTEFDPGTADSVTSSQQSDDDQHADIRFMCSFGGQILPRPHDNQLRYVGGDTRIVAVHRTIRFSALLERLSKFSNCTEISIKYQLPNEDFDALITVSSDEDVDNMMEEFDRLTQASNSKTARLRLFLFPINSSSASSFSSIIDGQSKRIREHWFLDALNGSGSRSEVSFSLERGRSEVSSNFSELPDFLFGFDNSDEPREPKPKTRPNLADSDPGSPIPAASYPYCSTSSVKTKLEDPIRMSDSKESQIDGFKETGEQLVSRHTGYMDNTTWQPQYYPASNIPGPAIQPVHVYYMPGPVPPGEVPATAIPMPATYVQRFPMRFAQPVHGMEAYEYPPAGVVPEVLNQQQAYYAARNSG
ncbi:hypothetical protein NE237_002044 [Protea cynaroides]|uniref:PB1 domain-containing protein n=1 Tax=Protea cynaroides TaxID=273540 RepID=A0A9Q0KU83_9MAGN|nr:hypothetical protein NE237_002044 [Protea cynaroides]